MYQNTYKPKEVKKDIGMSGKEWDEVQAKLYGYDGVTEMNKHNYLRDKNYELKYGKKGLV